VSVTHKRSFSVAFEFHGPSSTPMLLQLASAPSLQMILKEA
jgi:hypothetical protein